MNERQSMKDIANRIKNRRIELDLSYQNLADRTGLSKSTLQRYETGFIQNLPLDKLSVLAEALKVEPSYLMGWEDVQQNKSYIEGCEEATLVKKYSHLSDSNKKAVLNLIDNLLSAQIK